MKDGRIQVLFFQSQGYFGADSAIHSLLMRYYDRSRVDVHVACNYGTRGYKSAALEALEAIPNLHIYRANFGPTLTGQSGKALVRSIIPALPAPWGMFRLAWYIKRNRIDIIHGTEKPRDAFYGVVMARLTGVKSVIHLHVKCDSWFSPLVKWALRRASVTIGISDFVAKSTIAEGYNPGTVQYVLNALEASRWDHTTDGTAIRDEFGIAPNMPLLATISRLFYWKGQADLLKALARVREQVPDVKLLIVGEDDSRAHPGGGSFLDELKSQVHELHLEQNVIFTGFRKDVAQILAACDIYAMPSFEEPFGMVFLEALAMKRPVIALNSGGTPEVVEHGRSGLLSAPHDTDALACNIVSLINNPGLRSTMGKYGRQRVEEYFSPQRMANECERVYKHILKGTAPCRLSYEDQAR